LSSYERFAQSIVSTSVVPLRARGARKSPLWFDDAFLAGGGGGGGFAALDALGLEPEEIFSRADPYVLTLALFTREAFSFRPETVIRLARLVVGDWVGWTLAGKWCHRWVGEVVKPRLAHVVDVSIYALY
jgi:hypothetical protein